MLDPSTCQEIAEGKVTRVGGNKAILPKIQIIVATKSAEVGINRRHLEFGKMNGLPSSFYELLQQLGQIGRSKGQPGSNIFEVHIDFNSVVSFVVRIMKVKEARNDASRWSSYMRF